MKSETVSGKQAVCLMSLFIAGSAMITGNASWAKQDSWISLLLAGALCLPFVLIYARISSLFPGESFFDALFQIFGKVLGWIVCLIMTLYFFQIGLFAMRSFTEFAHVASLGRTPQIFLAVCLAALCGYTASKGLGVMGRCAAVMFIAAAAMIAFSAVMLAPSLDPKNLLPVMGRPAEDIASGTAAWFAYPLAESVALLSFGGWAGKERGKYKLYIGALCLGLALLLVPLLLNILSFGGEILDMMRFPYYISARFISIGGFMQRIEAFISASMLICAYARICVSVYAASRGFAKLLGASDYRRLAFPVAMLGAALSPLLFSNAMEMEEWIRRSVWLTVPLQTALPVVIWLGAELCAKKRKGGAPANEGKSEEPLELG